MDADEIHRFDYEQTTQFMRSLADIRFKLLAFIPTIAGASVGLLGKNPSQSELLAVGLLGLVATVGILLHELRNSQVYKQLVDRAIVLERRLNFELVFDRSRINVTLFGLVTRGHDRGLGLVYGAALACWSYLVVWGALRALDLAHARTVGAAIGALVGSAVAIDVERRAPT